MDGVDGLIHTGRRPTDSVTTPGPWNVDDVERVGESVKVERITTADAARRLGVSPTTVRRRIAHGLLSAERHLRPQGVRFVVLWEEPQPTVQPVATEVEVGGVQGSQQGETIPDEPAGLAAWYWWLLVPAALAVGGGLGHWMNG